MNGRMKELAEQATIEEHDGFRYLDKDKFAKLIVKEMCVMMAQAEDDAFHCFDPSERPTEYIEWLNQWQTKFQKHFGVE